MKIKRPKPRNPVARSLASGAFKRRVVEDRKATASHPRKSKHKRELTEEDNAEAD